MSNRNTVTPACLLSLRETFQAPGARHGNQQAGRKTVSRLGHGGWGGVAAAACGGTAMSEMDKHESEKKSVLR
ncbi:MAG: hypothetical protein ACPIOQ_23010 [Promethearchaeia archaeon]